MTTQEKLLEAAEAAFGGNAYATLVRHGLDAISEEMLKNSDAFLSNISDKAGRALYLCFLAAAWDDL